MKAMFMNKLGQSRMATVMMIVVLTVCGCSKEMKKDTDMDKWSKLAETSRGHTPPMKRNDRKETVIAVKDNDTQSVMRAPSVDVDTMERQLPTANVNLKVRKAELKSVLRAMAASEGVNLLVKDNVVGSVTVDFSNTRWDKVFKSILKSYGLVYVWEDNIIRIVKQEDLELEEKRKSVAQDIKWVEPLESYVVKLNYAAAKDVKDNLIELLTKDKAQKPRGTIKVDEHTNSLIVNAIRDDIKKIVETVGIIDKPTPQIRIQANIVETTKEVAKNLGIQWGGLMAKHVARGNSLYVTPGGTSTSTTAGGAFGTYLPSYGSPGLSQQGFGVNFPVPTEAGAAAGGLGSLGLIYGALGGNLLEIQLQALQHDSKLRIISSPSITTLDNMKAYTESGNKVPYVSTSTSSGGVTTNVSFIDAVLRLEIVPHVIDNETLKMVILVKSDEVDNTRSVQGNPFIIKKETSTSLIVQDGETVVISGLTKDKHQVSSSGIPVLKDIPLIGNLFKNDSLDNTFEEVLIFITPHILPGRRQDFSSIGVMSSTRERDAAEAD